MAIEVYHGKYVVAEDATQIMDVETIREDCKKIKDVSEKLDSISEKIKQLKLNCSKDVLSVRGVDLEDRFGDYEKDVKDFSLYLSDLSDTISAAMQRVLNRKQVIFNEEAKRMDEREEQLNGHNTVDSTIHFGIEGEGNQDEILSEVPVSNSNSTTTIVYDENGNPDHAVVQASVVIARSPEDVNAINS